MQTYRITSPTFVAALIVGGDTVLQAGPILGWTVGQPFESARDYCRKRGWIVEPLADDARPTWLEIDGSVYEIEWKDNAIASITIHESGEEPRELSWEELPEVLKEQL